MAFVNYFQDNWAELLPMMDYAQATLPQDLTGFASIQLEMGYLPCTSFDWDRPIGPQTVCERLSHEEAQQYVKCLEQAITKTQRKNVVELNIIYVHDTPVMELSSGSSNSFWLEPSSHGVELQELQELQGKAQLQSTAL